VLGAMVDQCDARADTTEYTAGYFIHPNVGRVVAKNLNNFQWGE
jgi:hypothetical protein